MPKIEPGASRREAQTLPLCLPNTERISRNPFALPSLQFSVQLILKLGASREEALHQKSTMTNCNMMYKKSVSVFLFKCKIRRFLTSFSLHVRLLHSIFSQQSNFLWMGDLNQGSLLPKATTLPNVPRKMTFQSKIRWALGDRFGKFVSRTSLPSKFSQYFRSRGFLDLRL